MTRYEFNACDAENESLRYQVKELKKQKRDLMVKVIDWIEDYLIEIGASEDWSRKSPSTLNGKERFIRDMTQEG